MQLVTGGIGLLDVANKQVHDAVCPPNLRKFRTKDEKQGSRRTSAFNTSFASLNAAKVFMKEMAWTIPWQKLSR